MPDPNLAQLLASLLIALFTGTWQPAPADIVAATQPQPVQLSATWHPYGQPGNEQDLYVVAADGTVYGGATSSAVSPPKH
jgi:hypothetical protein